MYAFENIVPSGTSSPSYVLHALIEYAQFFVANDVVTPPPLPTHLKNQRLLFQSVCAFALFQVPLNQISNSLPKYE